MTDWNDGLEAEALIDRIVADQPLKAAGFIVTIYGDVVEPRGGVVWIGNLIETCSRVGISETLVRTAVSRLVSSGQLVGEREGRRSFYRLSDSARAEFAAAADVLFGEQQEVGWQFVQVGGPAQEDAMQALERAGYARLNARLAVGPQRPLPMGAETLVFNAQIAQGTEGLRAFAADYWDLSPHAVAYRDFLERFSPLARLLDDGVQPNPAACLTARLLLVHQFRAVALRDPRLPAAALPEDWPAVPARRLFARLYCQLSPGADLQVARHFVTASGSLPNESAITRRRLMALARSDQSEEIGA
jgi:phenylacetic acid degradation operon negative regulatory protein